MIALLALLITTAAPEPVSEQCDSGGTFGMAQCMDRKIERAKTRLNEYRARALQRFQERDDRDPATAKALEGAAIVADAYRETYCGAVYQRWSEGSIRYAMDQGCKLRLIDRETHDLWRDFLGYIQDDMPPLLPEPKPTN